jgi:hypothetical protein
MSLTYSIRMETPALSLEQGDTILFSNISFYVSEIIRKNSKIVIVLLSRNNKLFSHTFRSETLLQLM